MSITYRELKYHEFTQALRIRLEVFVEEQKVPLEEEHDSWDLTAQHFGVFAEDALVGTGRLVTCGKRGIIGRVAVLQGFRGLGLGSGLIRLMVTKAQEAGLDEISLGAQVRAEGFYERLGFRGEGPEFLDAGIPHRAMHYHFVHSEGIES